MGTGKPTGHQVDESQCPPTSPAGSTQGPLAVVPAAEVPVLPPEVAEIARTAPSARVDLPPPTGLVLRTPRMLLRALRDSDREAFLAAVAATREQLDLYIPLHQPGESDERMFARQLDLAAATASARYTAAPYIRLVGFLSDGTVAGGFNINTIMRGLEWKADINWWVVSPLAGGGLATEGIAAILRFALTDLPDGLGLHIVHAWITRDNPASIRAAEKAGLIRAGEEKSYVSTGGRWLLHDQYIASAGAA